MTQLTLDETQKWLKTLNIDYTIEELKKLKELDL